MYRRAAAAVAVVLVGLVVGCARQAEPQPVPSRVPGPAEAYLEAALGVTSDDAAAGALHMEEAVAACMAEQGFEYVPDTSGYHYVDAAAIDPPPGSREFAELYGYGFAALPEEMRAESTPGVNPNDAILGAMSPEELEAYQQALWGDAVGADPDAGGEVDLAGCFGAAREQVWGDREEDPVRLALEEEITRVDAEAAPTDAAVSAAAGRWSACMSDAGHPGYGTSPDAEEAAWDRWTAFNDAIAADPALGQEGPDGLILGQAGLADDEAALATADWDCRAETRYDDVWQEARDRLQQEYVDAHRAELDAWVETFS
ncbi:hypothetical protein [Cellulomonas sp. KRMCY2]|uniref:hypothetical protein n=1 Tax=Cellulomonas sp. KRMCY2 TaxID=1304865 RepID=UPI00045E6576|nr:hypothetical protein [Cellulomonas sp. KRMCY2]